MFRCANQRGISSWSSAMQRTLLAAMMAALLVVPAAEAGPGPLTQPTKDPVPSPRVKREIAGAVNTRAGERLVLSTDLGSIQIHTRETDRVEYHAVLTTDATKPDAQEILQQFTLVARPEAGRVILRGQVLSSKLTGRLWVTIDVSVPRKYNLDITTRGGNIDSEDVDGGVSLATAGGNISVGSLGASAKLETGGGHITVRDVAGDLSAVTGGGHIVAGNISGAATLRTGGGHIRVASIGGIARLGTGGGNVSVEKVAKELFADTGGGQIEVGEAAGIVRARTSGGGIRVVRASGPATLESNSGSIYLTQVDSPVRAFTSAGGITAWLGNTAKIPGGCDLQSSDGDIVVYIPKELPITIDASIQLGGAHGFTVDPALPIKVSYEDQSNGKHVIRAAGELNGGGELLRLRTVAGNIRLVLSDTAKQVKIYKLQMEQLQRKLVELQDQKDVTDKTDGPPADN
jgi:Putative adhesin